MKLLTDSELRSARACQRLHRLRYELGYRPAEEAGPLRFGSLVHRGLEGWWRATGQARLPTALEAMATEADPFELVKAQVMLAAYDARWRDEPYEVLGVEVEFRTALVNPSTGHASKTWELAGKIDAIVRDYRDGRVLNVEHKTASGDISTGSDYWKRLRLDGQVSMYYVGAGALGFNVDGCLYDVLGKPDLRPFKATPEAARKYKKTGELYAGQRAEDETPEEYGARVAQALAEEPNRYFQRGEVVRLEGEVADANYDTWQLAQQIRESERLGRAPRNPDACVRYGRLCEFFPVCTGEASLDDTARFRRSSNVHPELSAEATQ